MIEKVKIFFGLIANRHLAYNRVFPNNSVDAKIVLKDLAKFCRAHDSTFHKDQRVHAVLEGRREVWLRIMEHLQFTPNQIYELHRIMEVGEGDE